MTSPCYSGYRFPSDIIQRAIWLYLRFTFSWGGNKNCSQTHAGIINQRQLSLCS
jgi:hypothetical protein